jgi:hypothetical protein
MTTLPTSQEPPRGRGRTTATQGDGEFRGSATMDVAVISGATFTNKSVTFYEVAGMAIIEGDIALGPVDRVREHTARAREAVTENPNVARGVGITGSQFRWPNCVIPYEIDPALPNQQRITDAIAHWQANTSFRLVLRTPANATQYPNYVRFADVDGGCWSLVGMQGGQQPINLGPGCSAGNAIHEIGHTVGLWHEQSREDRDLFVTINWQNIQSGMAAQFNQHITDGDDLGNYDYGSIMHYPRNAFTKNGLDTITPTDPNAQIGQRNGLSAGDLAAVRAMYPSCQIKRPWTEPPVGGFKKRLDDTRFKKIRDDNVIVKAFRDPKLPRDPGPVKATLDPIVINPLELVTTPGILQPFAIATQHHAQIAGMASEPTADDATLTYLAALQSQMLDVQAAIAQAQATAAQANAEAARLQQASESIASALDQAVADMGGQTGLEGLQTP